MTNRTGILPASETHCQVFWLYLEQNVLQLLIKSSVFRSIFLLSVNSVLYYYGNSTITFFVPCILGRDKFSRSMEIKMFVKPSFFFWVCNDK